MNSQPKPIKMILQKLVSYIDFLRASTNEHDLHSPFVYSYTTECLYQKPHKNTVKSDMIFFKTAKYFNTDSPSIQNRELLSKLPSGFSKASPERISDSILCYFNDQWSEIVNNLNFTKDHIVILKAPYKNKEHYAAWKQLIKEKQITQSIDLFHTGVLFFRNEAVKEHFCLRY